MATTAKPRSPSRDGIVAMEVGHRFEDHHYAVGARVEPSANLDPGGQNGDAFERRTGLSVDDPSFERLPQVDRRASPEGQNDHEDCQSGTHVEHPSHGGIPSHYIESTRQTPSSPRRKSTRKRRSCPSIVRFSPYSATLSEMVSVTSGEYDPMMSGMNGRRASKIGP